MSSSVAHFNDVTLPGRRRPRLENVSCVIPEGVTAVMGNSGAGKTSLLNVLVGYEKVSGGELRKPDSIYWVPPNFGLWEAFSVKQHLLAVSNQQTNLLEAFDLDDCAEAYPHQLSLGQQARVAVARALATNAACLVMDEPLSHIDRERLPGYWQTIREHTRERSLVFSSHEPETVLAEASHVICLQEGRLRYQGDVATLYERPGSAELAAYLGRTNWIEREEAAKWLQPFPSSWPRSIRPETLALVPSSTSALQVSHVIRRGAVTESELLHSETGEKAAFLHQTPPKQIEVGAQVLLKVLMVVVALLALPACHERSEAPQLVYEEISSWKIPIDGPKLPAPRSVATGVDDEIVALDNAGRVLVYHADGTIKHRWAMPDTANGRPEGVLVLSDGTIVVCDTHYHQIVYFSPVGGILHSFGKYGRKPGEFIYPVAIAKDPQENLYIGEYGENDRIQKFRRDGTLVKVFGSFGTEPGQFQRPSGITWQDGYLYVADAVNNRVQVFTDDGEFVKVLAIGFNDRPLSLHLPYDLAACSSGHLYLVEYGAARITKMRKDGTIIGQLGSQGTRRGQFLNPWGLTVDSEERLRVADTGNRRLVALNKPMKP